ncbi:MAG TPA: hypothetical protein VGM58_06940 [Verrucomicrobiae bacterium]|jgi:uncharacterized membrane protein
MSLFTKADDKFVKYATDSNLRQIAIASRTQTRNSFFWTAIFLFAMAIIGLGHTSNTTFLFSLVGASFMTCLCFKFESDLRLLKIVERLQNSGSKS